MRLWRVLPWDPSASAGAPGDALWVPRAFQGTGRHDAPDRYGCLYLAEEAVSAVAATLAPFRGTGDMRPELLVRSGRQLALAELELDARAVPKPRQPTDGSLAVMSTSQPLVRRRDLEDIQQRPSPRRCADGIESPTNVS